MTCERYWRDGILLDERGERDPHRDTCDDCRRAHRDRELLVRALPEVGATSAGDPDWQSQVWRRIARRETSRARRSYWLGGALAAAGLAAAIGLYLTSQHPAGGPAGGTAELAERSTGSGARPRIEIVSSPEAMRSTPSAGTPSSARVGDRVRISVGPGSEVRIYRADRLVLRCPAWQASPGCTPDAVGLIADAVLAPAGDYQLVTITSVNVDPAGVLDRDLAAVVDAGGDYRLTDLSVR
ncbi:MAG TPA: hypothetical protein VHT91_17060 [Kofleriaceae bacterium]|jgi:hypothetical protein|nr:hypothetical protein [Kofleriaceae bacterium]